jgi:hypothetical protein
MIEASEGAKYRGISQAARVSGFLTDGDGL